MKKNFLIRFAREDEKDLVRNLDPHSKYIKPLRTKQQLEDKRIILAFDQDQPVGLIKFSYFWDTRPYIDLIWLKEAYRGLGIGTKLLKFLEDYLVKAGCSYLFISAQENEPKALKWHQSRGFKICGSLDKINLPQEDTKEIFLYKQISSNTKLLTYENN